MPGDIVEYIARRKQEINALILAHFYQNPEIQDIADFVGDSLQLAQQAKATDADVIVFCGVSFMAESAKILNPAKTVLLPDKEGHCPMAAMVTAEQLRQKKAQYPGAVVVTYINSSAEVKAESDICCTSSNAVKVIESIPADQPIIFVPDKNLGRYIEEQTGRPMILWDGYCPVHDVLTAAEVEKQIKEHPQALLVVHPECPPEVTSRAHAVRSTAGILKYVQASPAEEFIIGTEEGFLHTLTQNCPGKKFYLAKSGFRCDDMKYITLEKLAAALRNLEYQVEVDDNIREKAGKSLQRMLAIVP
ncbi:MAG: quinolinate synthase NadA [Syntrophomonadaceae bacterium]|jgi:quinolinate synthase